MMIETLITWPKFEAISRTVSRLWMAILLGRKG
jgi:hypothetical protein